MSNSNNNGELEFPVKFNRQIAMDSTVLLTGNVGRCIRQYFEKLVQDQHGSQQNQPKNTENKIYINK